MIWAIVNNVKTEVTPRTEGICDICKGRVFSKCGEINVWHWAHFSGKNCDSWFEPESLWHKRWKMTFGKENAEIRIEKDGKYHIADILTSQNIVIELQNSNISKPIIRQREEFYGERMIWLVNGEKFKSSLTAKDIWEDQDYLELQSLPRPPVRWERRAPAIQKGVHGQFFRWNKPRRSWEDVQRPVFVDFGTESLFMVKEGMGMFQMRGTYISKEKFITKYGGNYEYYVKSSR